MQGPKRQPNKRNPYVAGKALGTDHGFFGRDDILRVVQDTLSSGHQNAIVLAGQRRIGKTSILLQLQRRLPQERFLPVYFDLMDRAEEPLGRVLGVLAGFINAEMGRKNEDLHWDDGGLAFEQQFLPKLYETFGPDRRPVLLFDEFDVLDAATRRPLEGTAAALKFFPYVRHLMEKDGRLGFVFVVGRKPDELSIQFKAAFKAALFKKVSVLESGDARRLILSAERDESLRFEPAAVERILALTSGHPLFTQLICQILWDRSYAEPTEEVPAISAVLVDTVVDRTLEAGENVFQWIWDGLPPAERIISAAIAKATQTRRTVSEDELLTTLQGHGIRILTRELHFAPETLVEWEILRKAEGGYQFFIELMRLWIERRKPLLQVKKELDRIVQPANELFRSAEAIYRHGDHPGVEQILQQVLRINPNHVNARLLMGELLLEEDRVDNAVSILEEAFQYDEDNARYPLIRALLRQGAKLESTNSGDAALQAYERVLALSPSERNAQERHAAIWVQRGEAFLAAGDFEAARQSFTAAGATEKFQKLEAAVRQQRIEEMSKEAFSLLDTRNFEGALPILEKVLILEPENESWQKRYEEAKAQVTLRRAYAEGRGALEIRDYERAVASLAHAVNLQPDFEDSAAQLAKAVMQLRRSRTKSHSVPNTVPQ